MFDRATVPFHHFIRSLRIIVCSFEERICFIAFICIRLFPRSRALPHAYACHWITCLPQQTGAILLFNVSTEYAWRSISDFPLIRFVHTSGGVNLHCLFGCSLATPNCALVNDSTAMTPQPFQCSLTKIPVLCFSLIFEKFFIEISSKNLCTVKVNLTRTRITGQVT